MMMEVIVFAEPGEAVFFSPALSLALLSHLFYCTYFLELGYTWTRIEKKDRARYARALSIPQRVSAALHSMPATCFS